MAEYFLDDSDVDALLHEERPGGVAGVVEPARSDARRGDDGLPPAPIVTAVDRVAGRRGEDQVVVVPARAGGKTFRRPAPCAVP
jgi:hypothetical protein